MTGKVGKLGIYIHIPFCASKCAYCDFYSKASGKILSTPVEEQMDLYQKALLTHFKTYRESARGMSVDTVYIGGGTPTFYGASRIDGLLRGLRKAFRIARDAEITVEGNPDSIDPKTLQVLRRCGVNRMSMGMQSVVEEELRAIGRPHSPEQAREAVSYMKKAQMHNISLDLMYGLPLQTFESWTQTLEEAIALEPQHLSCYGLKVEEGTPLFYRVEKGEILPDDELQSQCYLWTVERLAQAGYHHYEISNFAKEGYHSRHNMGYWLGKPYLGFGASASSDFAGYRYTYVSDLEEYCRCVLEGGAIFQSNDFITEGERAEEYIFLRLRTKQGICASEYEKLTQKSFSPLETRLKRFQGEGWVEPSLSGTWVMTAQGYLRSNLLLGDLLEIHCNEENAVNLQGQPPPILEKSKTSEKEKGTNGEGKTSEGLPNMEEKSDEDGIIWKETEEGQFFF